MQKLIHILRNFTQSWRKLIAFVLCLCVLAPNIVSAATPSEPLKATAPMQMMVNYHMVLNCYVNISLRAVKDYYDNYFLSRGWLDVDDLVVEKVGGGRTNGMVPHVAVSDYCLNLFATTRKEPLDAIASMDEFKGDSYLLNPGWYGTSGIGVGLTEDIDKYRTLVPLYDRIYTLLEIQDQKLENKTEPTPGGDPKGNPKAEAYWLTCMQNAKEGPVELLRYCISQEENGIELSELNSAGSLYDCVDRYNKDTIHFTIDGCEFLRARYRILSKAGAEQELVKLPVTPPAEVVPVGEQFTTVGGTVATLGVRTSLGAEVANTAKERASMIEDSVITAFEEFMATYPQHLWLKKIQRISNEVLKIYGNLTLALLQLKYKLPNMAYDSDKN